MFRSSRTTVTEISSTPVCSIFVYLWKQQCWQSYFSILFSFLWICDIKGRSNPVGVWPGLCSGSICQHAHSLLILALVILNVGSAAFCQWWLSYWSNQGCRVSLTPSSPPPHQSPQYHFLITITTLLLLSYPHYQTRLLSSFTDHHGIPGQYFSCEPRMYTCVCFVHSCCSSKSSEVLPLLRSGPLWIQHR